MRSDEMVDVIDENDNVIGSVWKSEAHSKGLLHRTVIAEVIGPDGKWTLVKQSSDRQDAGLLVNPIGGHVSSGETEDEAIKREAFEEYGLKENFEFKLIGKNVFNRDVNGRHENHLFILYEIYTDKKPVLNEESIGFERFSFVDIAKGIRETPEKFGGAFHFVIDNFYQKSL
jgi:isopentenyl-diphosphate delta-isomerase